MRTEWQRPTLLTGLVLVLAAIPLFLAGIWTGDIRFSQSAGVFLAFGLVPMLVATLSKL